MKNDIYSRVIDELSHKSEKDYGLKRVEEKTEVTRYIIKVVSLLLQLTAITIISSLFAIYFNGTSDLGINLYVTIVIVAVLGTLNYPSLWKKFTRKRIIFFILLISILIALKIITPAKMISQIDNRFPLFIWWGIMVIIASFGIYLITYNVVAAVELLLDLASVFLPVLPTMFGKYIPNLALETYEILYRETIAKETRKNNLQYLITASQADIDSAGVRSLPWVVLLGLGATSFSGIFSGTISFFTSVSILLGFLLLFTGLLAVFNIARMTYFQTLIIQKSNQLLIELSTSENTSQEKPNNFLVSTEINKPGCLLRILFPRKYSG